MSLITLKLQEASVFIVISAKVSVMKLECGWETSVRTRARRKDERHPFFLSFADGVGLRDLWRQRVREKDTDDSFEFKDVDTVLPSVMARRANFRPEWVICRVHILLNSCVLAGSECTKGAGPLTGTTTGLTGQLLLFMELFTAWGFCIVWKHPALGTSYLPVTRVYTEATAIKNGFEYFSPINKRCFSNSVFYLVCLKVNWLKCVLLRENPYICQK